MNDIFLLLKDAFYLFSIVGFVVVYALVAGKYWRGEEGEPNDIAPSAWPVSRAHWNGVVRSCSGVRERGRSRSGARSE